MEVVFVESGPSGNEVLGKRCAVAEGVAGLLAVLMLGALFFVVGGDEAGAGRPLATGTAAMPVSEVPASTAARFSEYRDGLTAAEAECYDVLEDGIRSFSGEIMLPEGEWGIGEVMDIANLVMQDNPDIFWIGVDWRSRLSDGGSVISVIPTYTYSYVDARALYRRHEDFAKSFFDGKRRDYGTGDIAEICRYLAEACWYDDSAVEASQNLDSAMFGGGTVCAGYSKAMAYIAQVNGVPAACVWGQAASGDGKWGNHAWVAFAGSDGEVLYCDPTWADKDEEDVFGAPVLKDKWLAGDSTEFSETHSPARDVCFSAA